MASTTSVCGSIFWIWFSGILALAAPSSGAPARGGPGDEVLMGAFAWLDLTPKGRNDGEGVMSWLKLHDEYGH